MQEGRIYEGRSEHHRITVEESEGVVSLRFNGCLQSSMRGEEGLDTLQRYLDFLHLTFAVRPDAKKVLVIGLGGGVLPKRIWHDYEHVLVDVVEIDPEVVEVARTYFGLPDDERLRVVVGDGRAYLGTTRERYDIIVVDAYFESSIPFDLATAEFFAVCKDHLTRDGVLAYNVVGVVSGRGSRPFHRFVKGLLSTFKATYIFPVRPDKPNRRQNVVALASDKLLNSQELRSRVRSRVDGMVRVPGFESFADHLLERSIPKSVRVISDADRPEDGLLHA